MIKKLFVVLCVLLALLTLSACGKKKNNGKENMLKDRQRLRRKQRRKPISFQCTA